MKRFINRRRALDGLEEDIRDHLERETRDNMERGMAPAEARAAALRKFGNVPLVEEETRAVWRRPWLEQSMQDLAFALRILRRDPTFTLVAVLTLAVGIGLNTAVFSVVNSVLLRPLEYPHPERLVWLGDYNPAVKRDIAMLSDYARWRTQSRSYSAMAAFSFQPAAFSGAHGGFPAATVVASGDFWTLTGATPALGHLFAPNENDAVVLTWDLFQTQFGADPAAVGSAVRVDGRTMTVIGVLPRDFRFQFPQWWSAAHPEPLEAYMAMAATGMEGRGGQVVASLRPGVSTGEALGELNAIQQQLHPNDQLRLHVDRLQDQLTGSARQALSILQAAGGLLLFMAIINIASLLLARASARRRELAIRLAVGAGQFRALRQLLVESVTLALAGGAMGLLLARGAVVVLARLGPHSIPRLNEASIDPRVLAFTLAISLAAGVLFGTAPAAALWRTDIQSALQEGSRGSGSAFGLRIRRVLVAGELALAVVLLTGAGLLVASFMRMNAREPGFAPEKILAMKMRLLVSQYDRARQGVYRDELLRRLSSIPGVAAAGIAFQPMFCCAPSFPNDTSLTATHLLHQNYASPGYFQAMGMQLKKGRWLTESDGDGVIMLNESMARAAFGPVDPIGRQLSVPTPKVVVGVVADMRYVRLDADATPEVFFPFQYGPTMASFDAAVRARDPQGVAAAVRREMAAIDPGSPPFDVKTLGTVLAESIAPQRFDLFLLATFAVSALVLALVGIYGVISYSVAARTREIGVRVALGARPGKVAGMIVREGMTVAIAGIAAGVTASFGLTRLMAGLLYGVGTTDPRIFTGAAATLGIAALLASWVPARKAAAIDPIGALRDG